EPEPLPEPELAPIAPAEEPEVEPEPTLDKAKPEVDFSNNTTQARRRRKVRERAEPKPNERPEPREVKREDAPEAGSEDAPKRSRGELSVSDFKVTGMIDHLPSVKIDPAKGPALRSGAPVLRGDKGRSVGVLDKSGQGMSLTPPGRLARADVRKVVNTNSRDIGRCQARAQKVRPDLNGKLVLQWTVMSNGSAANARVVYDDMGSPEFTDCAKAAVLRWVFPEPQGGAATVSYPFKVRNLKF
ncbi:MAG: AgmX/PglI C-terminal domain-containing protein, partial [Myxococcota bacterium]